MVGLPRLLGTGDAQVGDRVARQPRLGFGTPPGGTAIADLATRTGRGTGERGDCGWVVVGLRLVDDIDGFLLTLVLPVLRKETLPLKTGDNRRVILVGGEHPFTIVMVGSADHPEQSLFTRLSINDPVGVEDLVAAVLGVGLGKHHQLDIVGVAPHRLEVLHQIVDLILCQCQPQLTIGLLQRRASTTQHIDTHQWCRFSSGEECLRLFGRLQYRLGHAVMDHGEQLYFGIAIQRSINLDPPENATFDPVNLLKPTVISDIGRLGGPRGDGAHTRHDHPLLTAYPGLIVCRTILQQLFQNSLLSLFQCTVKINKMEPLGSDRLDRRNFPAQVPFQLLNTEW